MIQNVKVLLSNVDKFEEEMIESDIYFCWIQTTEKYNIYQIRI